jgi:hypothetical protein
VVGRCDVLRVARGIAGVVLLPPPMSATAAKGPGPSLVYSVSAAPSPSAC